MIPSTQTRCCMNKTPLLCWSQTPSLMHKPEEKAHSRQREGRNGVRAAEHLFVRSAPRKVLHVCSIWTTNAPSWGNSGLTSAPSVEEQIEDKHGTFALGISCQRHGEVGSWLGCPAPVTDLWRRGWKCTAWSPFLVFD